MASPLQRLKAVLVTVPGFADRWNAFTTESAGEPSHRLHLAMSELAHYLVEKIERNDTAELPQFFAEIEDIVTNGDAEAKNLIVAELFEDLQTVASRQKSRFDFLPWLGPASAVAWKQVADCMRRIEEWEAAHRMASELTRELDFEDMLERMTNPELRRIIEAMYRGRKH